MTIYYPLLLSIFRSQGLSPTYPCVFICSKLNFNGSFQIQEEESCSVTRDRPKLAGMVHGRRRFRWIQMKFILPGAI